MLPEILREDPQISSLHSPRGLQREDHQGEDLHLHPEDLPLPKSAGAEGGTRRAEAPVTEATATNTMTEQL